MRRSTGARLDRADELVAVPEDAAAERAVAERGDAARLGHRLVGGEERLAHAGRDRPGDEQHVGVARRGDDAEAEPLEVVVRARGEGQFVLAAVAGAGVDVADREAATAVGAWQPDRCGGGGGDRGAGSASAVGAGVAELEALVDEREVGQQVVGGGVCDGGPVGVGAGAEAEARDAVAVAVRRRRGSRRAGSRRGRCRSAASPRPRARLPRGRRGRSSSSSSEVEGSGASSSARCSSRARDVAVGRRRAARLEAGYASRGLRSRDVVARRRPRARPARRCRARSTSVAARTPMSGRRSWNEALNWSSRQPRPRRGRARELLARGGDCSLRRASSALPPTATCRTGTGARSAAR